MLGVSLVRMIMQIQFFPQYRIRHLQRRLYTYRPDQRGIHNLQNHRPVESLVTANLGLHSDLGTKLLYLERERER